MCTLQINASSRAYVRSEESNSHMAPTPVAPFDGHGVAALVVEIEWVFWMANIEGDLGWVREFVIARSCALSGGFSSAKVQLEH